MTQRIPIADARKNFANLLSRTRDGERVKLTRYNKTVAAIIPKQDLEKLKDCESQDQAAQAARAKSKSK